MRAGFRIKQHRNRYRALKWGKKKSTNIIAELVFYSIVIMLCSFVSYNLKIIVCNNSVIAGTADKKLTSEEIKAIVITDEMKQICSEIIHMSEELNKEQLDEIYSKSSKEIFWLTVLIRTGDNYLTLKSMDYVDLIKMVNMCCRSEEFKKTYDLCEKVNFAID